METEITRITADGASTLTDIVPDEIFLTLSVNGSEILTHLCSPENLKELSAGILFTMGAITSIDDIEKLTINARTSTSHIILKNNTFTETSFKRIYTSGCGKGMLFYNVTDLAYKSEVTGSITVASAKVTKLMDELQERSLTFKNTGGVHSAALCDGEKILVFQEDIGRHNALDKVIGEALYRNLDMGKFLFLTSGRISSEVMYKIRKTNASMIISRSAPTSLAIKLAEKFNITLVGFARGKRMNVYTAKERIGA